MNVFDKHRQRRVIYNDDADQQYSGYEGCSYGVHDEQSFIDAMYAAFADLGSPGRDFTTDDIVAALSKQVPISHSQKETVERLRTWLSEGRAQSASL